MTPLFRLIRASTDEVLLETPWRADLGREIVQHWHEVDDLLVHTERPESGAIARSEWARTWYGGDAQ